MEPTFFAQYKGYEFHCSPMRLRDGGFIPRPARLGRLRPQRDRHPRPRARAALRRRDRGRAPLVLAGPALGRHRLQRPGRGAVALPDFGPPRPRLSDARRARDPRHASRIRRFGPAAHAGATPAARTTARSRRAKVSSVGRARRTMRRPDRHGLSHAALPLFLLRLALSDVSRGSLFERGQHGATTRRRRAGCRRTCADGWCSGWSRMRSARSSSWCSVRRSRRWCSTCRARCRCRSMR